MSDTPVETSEAQESIGTAPDNIVPLKMPPRTQQQKMMDKQRNKAERLRQERRKQLLDNKVPEQLVDQIIQQEEYNRLPIDQKVLHLQHAVNQIQGSISQAMRQMASEMVALWRNQEEIADAFDINLQMLEQILIKLGVDEAFQKAILDETTKKFYEKKKLIEEEKAKARQAAQEASAAPQEKSSPNKELEQKDIEAEFKKTDSEASGIVSGS